MREEKNKDIQELFNKNDDIEEMIDEKRKKDISYDSENSNKEENWDIFFKYYWRN